MLSVGGTPVSAAFWSRLIQLTVNDREGEKSDSIEMDLEDGQPHLQIPDKGDEIECSMGYEGGPFDFMGKYIVDDVDIECLPWKMKIKGKSANMREDLKEHRERHWDNKPLKDVFGEIGREAGLKVQVAPSIGAFSYPWLAQMNESALHFVQRIAERHNGLFSIKNGTLIVAERGAGMTAGGTDIGVLEITPPIIIEGTCSVSFNQRERHSETDGEYHDIGTGERKRETAKDGDKGPTYTHRHGFSSKSEAKAAARSRAKYLKREGVRTAVEIEGNPYVKAGMHMTYAGVRPQVDGIVFTIEDVTHSYSKRRGYRTSIKGKIKDGDQPSGEATAGRTKVPAKPAAQASYPPGGV